MKTSRQTNNDDLSAGKSSSASTDIQGIKSTKAGSTNCAGGVTFSIKWLLLDLVGVVLLVVGYLEISGTAEVLPESLNQAWLPPALVILGLALMLPLGLQVLKRNFTSVKLNDDRGESQS